MYFFVLAMLNGIIFLQYSGYSINGVSYKKQMLLDFAAPVGAFCGRAAFKFSLKENRAGYICGFLLWFFITIVYFFVGV